MPQTTLPEILSKIVRDMVMNGKSKIETANELGISYYQVKKYTKDITVIQRIPLEVEQKIRADIRKGQSIRNVAKKLKVSRDSVIKYARDIPKKQKFMNKRSPEFIQEIRDNLRKYGSKMKTASKMGLSYGTVCYYTRDIIKQKIISKKEIKEISEMLMNGTPKGEIAKKLNISKNTVTKYTSGRGGGPHLKGRTVEILQQLLGDGYYFPKRGENSYCYTLRIHLPMICKVTMRSRTILFLEDKSDVAIRAYLSSLDKRISNYHKLKQVIKVFKTSIANEEKKKYVKKKRSKKVGHREDFSGAPPQENDDSFVKNVISIY